MSTLPTTLTASETRANLYDMLDEVKKYLTRFTITHHGKPQAVIISMEELENLEETAEILAIQGARSSISKGVKQAREGKGIPLRKLMQSL